MTIDNVQESAIYGRMAIVAINFHIQTGNLAELQAATCYARAAAYFANRELDGIHWVAPSIAAIINEYGLAQKLTTSLSVY